MLHSHWLLIPGVLVVVVCAVIATIFIFERRAEMISVATHNLQRGSAVLSGGIQPRIDLIDRGLAQLLARPAGTAPMLDAVAERWGVIDRDGRVLQGADVPATLAAPSWWVAPAAGREPGVIAEAEALLVTRPLRDAAGNIAGTAWALLPLAELKTLIDLLDLPAFGHAGVLRPDGTALLRWPPGQSQDDELRSTTRIRHSDLDAYVAVTAAMTLELWRNRALIMGALAVVVCLGVLALVILVVRQIKRQEQLSRSLAETSRILETAQDLAGLGTGLVDVPSGRVFWSDRVYEMRRQPRDRTFTPADVLAMIHPEDRQRYVDTRAAALARRESWSTILRVQHGDGEYGWEETVCRPEFDADGRLVSIIGVMRDLTAARRSAEALRAAKDDLDTIVASGPGVLCRMLEHSDGQMQLLYISPNVKDLIGISAARLLRMAPDAGYGPELAARRREALAQSETPGSAMLEYDVPHCDGRIVSVRSFIRRTNRADGLSEIIGYTIDVTAQRQAARALAEANAKLETLLDGSPGVFFQGSVAADGKAAGLFVSANIERLTGHKPEVFLDPARWMALREPVDNAIVEAVMLRARTVGSATHEYRVRHAEGHWLVLRSTFAARPDGAGGWLYTGTLLDITEEERLRRALEVARSELETVVASSPGILIRIVYAADGECLSSFVSRNVEAILGIPAEVAMRRSVWSRMVGTSMGALRRAALATSSTPDRAAVEYNMTLDSGRVLTVHEELRQVLHPDGTTELSAYVVDVTAKRAAERALAAAEAQQAMLLDESPGVLFQDSMCPAGDRMGRFVSSNIQRVTGYSPDVFVDLAHWESLRDPEQNLRVREAIRLGVANGHGIVEYAIPHADGQMLWLRSTFNVRSSGNGGHLITGMLLDVTEEHALRNALGLARAELETVTASGPGVLWRVINRRSGERETTYVSANVQEVMGLSVAEAIRPGAFSALAGQHLGDLRRTALRRSSTPGQAIVEYRMRHVLGHQIRLREAVRLIARADGAEEMIGYAVDITAQHGVEAALAVEQAKVAALVEDSPAVLFQTEVLADMSWRRLYISPNIERLTGYPPAFVLEGANWPTVIDPNMRDGWEDVLARAVVNGQASFEYRVRRPQGDWVWLRSTIRPANREGGGWLVTGTLMDTTREHDLTEEIGRIQADMQTVIDASPGVLYRAEVTPALSWHLTYVSAAIQRVTGHPAEQAQAALWGGEALDPACMQPLREAAMRVLRHETANMELRLRTRSGGWIWLRNTIRPDAEAARTAISADGGVTVIGYLTDISREKEQAIQLAHAARVATLGELTGGIAHDFNNMLAAISNCHAIVLRLSDDAMIREAMEIAGGAAERGANLVQQMLAFTRRRDVEAAAVDVGAMLSGLDGLLRQACGELVTLEIAAPPGIWPVGAERGALEMVIVNLATNARDAMPQGGRFRLEARNIDTDVSPAADLPPGAYVSLIARDTGHGMSSDILARSTERFFTTKPLGQGTGLGLAMAEGFVRHWGGALAITSEPGHGTEVELLLPRAGIVQPAASPRPALPNASRGESVILLVDDNEPVRRGVGMLLRMMGYEVHEAGGAEAALTTADGIGHIDLLLTDIVLPGESGISLAARLQRIRPELPTLFMTGYSGDAVQADGANVLRKPFTDAALQEAVRTALDR